MISTFPTLCPNLQDITLKCQLMDPVIAASVSELVLTTNRNALRAFCVDYPLTDEACEVIYKLPYLRKLATVIDEPSSHTMTLPNLTSIQVTYNDDHDWLQAFSGASLENLDSVTIQSESGSIDDFLEAFKGVALTTSMPATLSEFFFHTSRPWRPSYRSLLPFTQLTCLSVKFSCNSGCSSTIDDDTVTDLARAMPKLNSLHIGHAPCETPADVTTKGLSALARHCPRLSDLCIHFRLASLDPEQIPSPIPADESGAPRIDCALRCLWVGCMPLPEESTLMVTLTLLRIFPQLEDLVYGDDTWEAVADAIYKSKQLANWSSKNVCLLHFYVPLMIPP